MSASRSWDIQPSRKAPAKKAASQPEAAAPVRRSKARAEQIRRQPAPKDSLKQRRKKQQQTFTIICAVLALILVFGVMYGIWRPEVRVQNVQAEGPNPEQIQQVAMGALQGTYWYIFPRNSIFFYPEQDIRTAVQDAFPDVAAVSVSRSAFNKLTVSAVSRMSSFTWCGTSIDTPNVDGSCFETDAEGLVFKAADPSQTSSSTLKIFAPLNTDTPESPLRSKVVGAEHVPNALRFVKAIGSLGVPVMAVMIRGDEADIWVTPSTRITYVLGHEEDAAILAESAFPTLNFEDGTIQYVDLRFAKKVYVKRYGE